MNTPIPATHRLAEWSAQVPAPWPPRALDTARHWLEDTVAALVAGCGDPVSAAVRRTVAGTGKVPMAGGLAGASAADSALANGTAAHARELDEMYFVAGGHFGCVAIPALLATGYEEDTTLDRVLDALLVGSEVVARLGIALDRPHVEKGWHATSTLGAIGAAVACARLRGLGTEAMRDAIGLGVSMAAGPKVQFGTDAKPLHAGLAAQSGVRAAALAAAGVTASPQALEGAQGFGALYAGSHPPDWSTFAALGTQPLAIQEHGIAFKLYPNCASTHRCLDALAALMAEHGFDAGQVERVETRVGRVNLGNLRHSQPSTPREAMFSMHYAVATMLRFGSVTLADFTPQAVADPRTRALMARVALGLDPRAESGAEHAKQLLPHTTRVTLRDGRIVEREVAHARGMPGAPMDPAARRSKFEQCTAGILRPAEYAALRQCLDTPDAVPVRNLMDLLRFDARVDDGERFARTPGRAVPHHQGTQE